MSTTLSIELYDFLEQRYGKEVAREVTKTVEAGLEAVEKKAEGVALQKKLELKDELTKELATKADLLVLEERLEGNTKLIRSDFEGKMATLRMEFRVYFVILLAVIILVSPKAIDLIGKFLGVIK